MLKKNMGSYDEFGRRLDKVPKPEGDLRATSLTASPAAQQELYLTAIPGKDNDYVASSSRYMLRVTWLQPQVETYEYVLPLRS